MEQVSLLQIIGLLFFVFIGAGLFAIQLERFDDYRWHIFGGCVAAFLGTGIIAYLAYVPTPYTPPVDNFGGGKGGGGGGTGTGKGGKGGGGGGDKPGGGDGAGDGEEEASKAGGGGGGSKDAGMGGGKQLFSDCPNCPKMVRIPAGNNDIGSKPDDKAAQPNEFPLAWVKFSKSFAVSQFEITVENFSVFTDATGYQPSGPCNTDGVGGKKANYLKPGLSQSRKHPVVCVNVADATAYINWLSVEAGRPYRLLSEGEWEYVRRTVKDAKAVVVVTGEELPEVGNIKDDNWRAGTTAVGSFRGNDWLVYDMMGNVAELTADCWQPDHANQPKNGSAANGGDCTGRAVRGGSWDTRKKHTRPAARRRVAADARDWRIGFRVARSMTEKEKQAEGETGSGAGQ